MRFERLLIAAAICVGVAYRLNLAVTLPVGYDEVYVMAVGLEEMSASPGAAVLEVPATRSSALTPIWWWVQYVPLWVTGQISLAGLRVVPVILGLVTIPVAYYAFRQRMGRRAAGLLAVFVALSDILAFTNGRGEFAESLAVPAMLVVLSMLGAPRLAWWRGAVWLLLVGLSFGKGVFVIGLAALAEMAIALRGPGQRTLDTLRGLALSGLMVLIPLAAYFLAVQFRFDGQGLIHHEAADAESVFDLARLLTFQYAQVKVHVVGTVGEAALVWRDFGIWPTTVIFAIPLVGGFVAGVWRLIRSTGRPATRREALTGGLILWAVLGGAVVMVRGTLGARFHLLYMPAPWMLAALWLASWRRQSRQIALGLLVAVSAAAMCVTGPLFWAPAARFEPMPGSEALASYAAYRRGETDHVPSHGRTLYVDMANYHLKADPFTADHAARAVDYARRETQRVPNDARAWAYLGEAFLRQGASAQAVREAWERSLDLAPNERLTECLRELK